MGCPVNVSAVIPTRGDVDMQPILDSLPAEWEILIWDNGEQTCWVYESGKSREGFSDAVPGSDLAVYGRYAAIQYATHDLIYVQDDDVIVSDPQAIVRALVTRECPDCGRNEHQNMTDGSWICHACGCVTDLPDAVVCNMPQEFRPHYPDSGLVGFGAAFHRDAPKRAFERFAKGCAKLGRDDPWMPEPGFFNRRADNVFTTLNPRVLVDVPKTDREFASAPGRMWQQQGHTEERDRMIELARRVRDAR